MNKIKVRFAPSPTGPLHIGGARSALFNYLFASHYDGELVLRIEDTDLERSRREFEEEIINSLQWLGIKWTEGMGAKGENGPYRQTERLDIYEEYTRRLLESDQAYYCFCSGEELEEERKSLLNSGQLQKYSGKCRNLTSAEKEERISRGIKPAVRFKVPGHKLFVVDDLVRGRVSFESDEIGDFIIVKSDGIPTYNFAVVIDDVLMGISHVIRAEEHLSNTPRQLMIYDALNFRRPEFAHISLILGSDRQKMSKRHGATSLIQYREMGYLPEALFNFLSLMGWSPEGEEELLSPAQIIAAFTLDRVAKNPAVFDIDKLNWINQQYLKKLDDEELQKMVKPYLMNSKFAQEVEGLDDDRYGIMIAAIRDYLVCLGDAAEHAEVFLGSLEYEDEALEVLRTEGVLPVLHFFRDNLPESSGVEDFKQFIKSIGKELKLKPKNVFMPLRCALSGRVHGPELPNIIAVLGREESIKRIEQAISLLESTA